MGLNVPQTLAGAHPARSWKPTWIHGSTTAYCFNKADQLPLFLHPPSQLTYSNTQNPTAASCNEPGTRGQISQSATPALNRGVGQEKHRGRGFPGEEPKCRGSVPCPGHPGRSCRSPALPHPEPDLVSRTRPVPESALEGTACFSTACSREIQLVEERSAVIYSRAPSYSPEGLRCRGRRGSGRLRSSAAAQAAPARAPARHPGTERGERGFPWLPPMQIPPGERRRRPDSPRRPLGGSAPRPGLPGAASPAALSVTPASRPRSAPLRGPAPRRSAPLRTAEGNGQLGHPAAAATGGGSADNPPATTHPSGSGMEYRKAQRKSGWTVLGAKCWKFRNYNLAADSWTQ
ncbi:uncharacterized protein LOC141939973 [Strix uralensis]|uniref:uncharacterized protein LOC141939973 n=1 Tax=Strix uralensis TaxID=36305 RepID=UPI003DA73D6A